eukprot:12065096-Alexandrium_andersonii.AAC.1
MCIRDRRTFYRGASVVVALAAALCAYVCGVRCAVCGVRCAVCGVRLSLIHISEPTRLALI